MRTCKVILVILFVLMTALTCFSHFYRQESVDDTPPGMIGTGTSRAKSWWITFPP